LNAPDRVGRSDDPGRGYDYDTLADDLGALLERLDLYDVTLVAHSMGGGELVRYSAATATRAWPQLALVAATLPFPHKSADNPDGLDGNLFEWARAQWRADFPRWIEENAQPYVGTLAPPPAVSRELVDWTRLDMLQTSLQALLECNRAIVETDFRTELRALRVPTLIVQGDRDCSIPLELSGRRTVQLVPGARLEVYADAPHGLYLSHRERLSRDLYDFASGSVAVSAARRLG
jgi:pimeloyl-ACP methyl ester carboxylesterase